MRKNGSRRKMRRNGRKIVPFREKSFHTPTDLWDAGAYAGKQHVAAYRPMAKRFDSANSKIAQNKVYTALNKRVARDATAAAKRMGYDRGQAIDFKEGYWHAVTKELF